MDRRDLVKRGAATLISGLPRVATAAKLQVQTSAPENVEQWGLFEVTLRGTDKGNPFQEVQLTAKFSQAHRTVTVTGFYDGGGTYRVRFMPDSLGPWTYSVISSDAEMHGRTGSLRCVAPSAGNHGPVTTAHRFHFVHADGTSYFPFGTTTYAYLFARDEDAAHSLAGMRGVFNKSRVCVLPKPLGQGPQLLPFPVSGADANGRNGRNDYTRFNPEYFQLLEKRLVSLQAAGVEADCILFHPYDAWGYKAMPNEVDDFYLRYVVARFAAYRHVWWSIANEYDLVKAKTMSDWDRFFRIVQAEDPYSHLRSIHHSGVIYDHSKPWCTHASLQSWDFEKSQARREAWNKPIIYDEIQYEGDVDRRWGNLSAEEMTRRFWLALVYGAYASHGEVFGSTDDAGQHAKESSWSDAGRLRGESAPRLKWMHDLVSRYTRTGFDESAAAYYLNCADAAGNLIWYFDFHRPAHYDFPLPVTANYEAALIDPFARTEQKLAGTFTGKSRIKLANKPYQAVAFRKISEVTGTPKGKQAGPEVMD